MSTNETMVRKSRRPTHAPLGGRGLRRGAASRRGQVLLVAVFVLFGVAVLAALFIGILGAHIMQVARYTDVGALRQAAEGGLRLANDRLLYSAPGADWRPGGQAIPVGEGEVRLKVSYGPTPDDLQSRYLLVTATATLPGNPFASYTVLGRKSLLLTDYARFITDRYELRQVATLGVTGVEGMGQVERGDYLFRVAGPVFSNTDLAWYGPAEVQLSTSSGPVDLLSPLGDTWQRLGILRDDRIEVAGNLRSGASLTGAAQGDDKLLAAQPLALRVLSASGSTVSNMFKPNVDSPSSPEALKYTSGFPDLRPDLTPVGNTWRVLADLPTYNAPPPGQSLYPGSYAVPRVQPPRMDAIEPDLHTNRYLTLTRDSGMWLRTGTDFVNNGAWGWGWVYKGGLYLDNSSDLQYVDRFGNHNLEALRLNWTGGYSRNVSPDPANPTVQVGVDGRDKSTTNWWDKSGRFYLPPGVEIILHGEAQALQGVQACPYIEVIRHDRRPYPDPSDPTKTKWYYWRKPNGEYIPADKVAPTPYTAQGDVCNPLFGEPAVNVRQNRAILPFPPNGVIYAEGNVRIRGVMPPARHAAADSPYFADDYSGAAQWGRTRRYDLQVVSGGTIYIEGDLLTPTSAGLQPAGMTSTIDKVKWEVINGSRLALLARDYVCLNTTALQPRPTSLFAVGPQGELTAASYGDDQPRYRDPRELLLPSYSHFTVPKEDPINLAPPSDYDGHPFATTPPFVDYIYYNVRFQLPTLANLLLSDQMQTGFLLGHSAWYRKNGMDDDNTELATAPPPEGKDAKVEVELRVDSPPNDYWPWAGNKQWYTFRTEAAGGTDVAQAFSNHWYDETGTRAPFSSDPLLPSNNYLEFLVFAGRRVSTTGMAYQLSGEDLIRLTPRVYPVWNKDTDNPQWIVKPKELGYIFGPLAITPPRGKPPLPVQIEAMVYAQNGSWFVLPGPWFNEDPHDTLPPSAFGSPAALQTALAAYPGPIYHEPLNIQLLFSGAISENMPASLGDVADWTSKWAGLLNSGQPSLSYSYDPLLRSYRIQDTYRYARFPNLPLSPDLLIWGERVTGVSAAGL